MKTHQISAEERERAFGSIKKPEVKDRQKLHVRYHVEDFDVHDLPHAMLEPEPKTPTQDKFATQLANLIAL